MRIPFPNMREVIREGKYKSRVAGPLREMQQIPFAVFSVV